MKKNKVLIKLLKGEDIFPLICAAAALRKELKLRQLILRARSIGIKGKSLYESLLQNYLFTGYPSAMVSLKILSEYFPLTKIVSQESWDLNKYRTRGTINCKKVYGRKFSKLISNVKDFSPELSDWLILEGYGKVMGRRGLSFKQRELNNVAVLTCLRFEEQLYSHINGAFKVNATINELEKVVGNLKLFGRNDLYRFGLKVLRKYQKQKGIS